MRTRKQTFIATLDPPPLPSRHSHPPCAPQPPPPYNAKMSTSSLSTQYTTRSNLGVPDNVLLRAKLSVVQQNRRQRRSRRSVAASSGLGGWRACRLDDTLVRRRQNPTRCQLDSPLSCLGVFFFHCDHAGLLISAEVVQVEEGDDHVSPACKPHTEGLPQNAPR